MNMEYIKNNDPIQLQQMIIFLKAELDKNEQKVQAYENSYHHSVLDSLEQENEQLIKEKKELKQKLREAQKKKDRLHAQTLFNTKNAWFPLYKQFSKIEKQIQEKTLSQDQNRGNLEQEIVFIQKEFVEYKAILEQIEVKIIDYIQKLTQQVHTEIKNVSFSNEEHFQLKKNEQKLREKLAKQKSEIVQLQNKIRQLEEEKRRNAVHVNDEQAFTTELLFQIEQQIKKIAAKSVAYENDLEDKLALIHILELKLAQLSKKIQDMEEA